MVAGVECLEHPRLQIQIVKRIRSVLVENLAGDIKFGKVGTEVLGAESVWHGDR